MGKDKFLYMLYWLLQPLNRATGRRWAYITFLGITGGVLCFLLCPLLQNISEGIIWMTDYLWNLTACVPDRDTLLFLDWTLGFLLYLILLSIPIGLGVAVLIQMGALRWNHWRRILLYPPVWLAGLWPVPVGYIFLPDCSDNIETLIFTYSLIAFSAVVALSIRSLLIPRDKNTSKIKRSKNETEPPPQTAKETLEKFRDHPEELIQWLTKDNAVETSKDDLFEYHEHAHRIAEWLTLHRLPSVGLIGPYGIGKTTVLNLLKEWIQSDSFREDYKKRWRENTENNRRQKYQPPQIITCRVEAWGYSGNSWTNFGQNRAKYGRAWQNGTVGYRCKFSSMRQTKGLRKNGRKNNPRHLPAGRSVRNDLIILSKVEGSYGFLSMRFFDFVACSLRSQATSLRMTTYYTLSDKFSHTPTPCPSQAQISCMSNQVS